MNKDIYYAYINSEDLNRFLVYNYIFPFNNQDVSFRSLSLKYDNCLLLTKKRLSKEFIINKCANSLNYPVVLELSISKESPVHLLSIGPNQKYISELKIIDSDHILLNDIISFNLVKKIHFVTEKVRKSLYKDIYLYDSLKSEFEFSYGDDILKSEDLIINTELINNISIRLKMFSKIQAAYSTRFGFLEEKKYKKKTQIFFANIDETSFQYITNIPGLKLDDLINQRYSQADKPTKLSQKQTFFELNKTTFLNDNFEYLISIALGTNSPNCINIKPYKEEEEEKDFYISLYKSCLHYDGTDCLLDFFEKNAYSTVRWYANSLKKVVETNRDIGSLREHFSKKPNTKLLTLFLMCEIVKRDLKDAIDYLSNFMEYGELRKEIVTMYGLARGMPQIDISLKMNPSIMLFSFNKAKRHFNNVVDMGENFENFYNDRQFTPDKIMADGFNLIFIDSLKEQEYLNSYYTDLILRDGIDKKYISKEIIKIKDINKLHEAYLRARKMVK